MDLKQLLAFRAVAETLSFTRAAARLGLAQSTVTVQVRNLEDALGPPLFNRLGKSISLTQAGAELLPYAQQILSLSEEVQQNIGRVGTVEGHLRIGAPEAVVVYRLPNILRTFRVRYPQVQVSVQAGHCGDLRRALRAGALDLALLLEAHIGDPAIEVQDLVADAVLLVAAPEHLLARRSAVTPNDLAGQSVLTGAVGCTYRNLLERALGAAGVQPAAWQVMNSPEALKLTAEAGLGVAVLPRIAVQAELSLRRLAALAWRGPALQAALSLARHKDSWLTGTMRAFIHLTQTLVAGAAGRAAR